MANCPRCSSDLLARAGDTQQTAQDFKGKLISYAFHMEKQARTFWSWKLSAREQLDRFQDLMYEEAMKLERVRCKRKRIYEV